MDRRRRLMANNVGSALDTLLTSGLTFFAPLTDTVVFGRGAGSATFTRATIATVTDHEDVLLNCLSGEVRFQGARRVANRLSATEAITGASWTAQLTGSATAGATDPLGGTTATQLDFPVSGDGWKQTSATVPAGSSTVSVWLRGDVAGTIRINSNSGTQLPGTDLSITTTWARYSTGVGTGAADAQWWIRRFDAGQLSRVYIWRPQWESVTGQSIQTPGEYVSVGVLSSPYHGAMVDGVKYFATTNGNTVASNVVTEATGSPISLATLKGYLAEGARTNLCLQSNAFTTTWVPTGGASPTQNQTGPDGATSAWTITGTGSNYCDQTITLTATTYTASVFVKKTTSATSFPVIELFGSPLMGICTLDTNNGVATVWTSRLGGWTITTSSAACVDAGNFWRVSLTFLATAAVWTMRMTPGGASSATQSSGAPVGAGTNVYYGAQLEAGSFASTYTPTTTVAVPRNADVLTYTFAGNASASAGTLYVEIRRNGASGPVTFLSLNNSISTDYVSLEGFGANIYGAVVTGGVTQALVATTAIGVDTSAKMAMSYAANDVKGCVNAGTVGTDATVTLPSLNLIAIGAVAGSNFAFGTIRNVRIYSTQLSASQLQAVTA